MPTQQALSAARQAAERAASAAQAVQRAAKHMLYVNAVNQQEIKTKRNRIIKGVGVFLGVGLVIALLVVLFKVFIAAIIVSALSAVVIVVLKGKEYLNEQRHRDACKNRSVSKQAGTGSQQGLASHSLGNPAVVPNAPFMTRTSPESAARVSGEGPASTEQPLLGPVPA